jgi:hypothetical protein
MLPLAGLLPTSPDPYLALMLAGFAFGILGHLSGAKWLVAVGVTLIFLGTLLLPLVANLTSEDRPPAIEESRSGDAGSP